MPIGHVGLLQYDHLSNLNTTVHLELPRLFVLHCETTPWIGPLSSVIATRDSRRILHNYYTGIHIPLH
jgi:hypothetical protein